ncbi:MAG TPA: cytochrome b [Terricaulis sp.]|nr:cytochrome b [Terricaulis sp.]
MTTPTQPSSAPDNSEQTRPHYHPIGVGFHWSMALLVAFQLWWGWRVAGMPAGYDKLEAQAIHALIGAILLCLAFLRAGWRLIAPFILPDLEKPEDLPGWQRLAAEATHLSLYLLMFALPLSGWLMLALSAENGTVTLAGGLALPAMPFVAEMSFVERAQLERRALNVHLFSIWAIMLLATLHIGSALKHHFVDRNDVLVRMIPALSPRPARSEEKTRRAIITKAAK